MNIKKFENYNGCILYTAKDNILYEINVKNANLEINFDTGFITWHSGYFLNGLFFNGIWHNGTWYNGTWYNGTWYNGTWQDGIWYNGRFGAYIYEKNIPLWENGTWKNGFWYDGIWKNGTWENGIWKDGVWENGIWECGKICKKNGKTIFSKKCP